MFCNMCGANIPDGADFCPNCGADLRAFKQPQPAEQAAQEAAKQVAQEAAEAAANAEPEQISAASTTPMMDIPIADAPDELDPESGTTVLTADMSGPLTSSSEPSGFAEAAEPEATASEILVSQQVAGQVAGPAPESAEPIKDEAHQHEFQAPEGKIVTPAPVTGSSILSDSNVVQSQVETPAQGQSFNAAQAAAPVQTAQQASSYNQYMPAGGAQGTTVINQMQSGEVPESYRPISPWGYLGYTLLFNIPIVGLILMFVWGFGDTNKNLKNYARFFLLTLLISLIISIIIGVITAIMGVTIFGALSDY